MNKALIISAFTLLSSCYKEDLAVHAIVGDISVQNSLPNDTDSLVNKLTITYSGDTTVFPYVEYRKYKSYRTLDNVIYNGTKNVTYYKNKNIAPVGTKYSESTYSADFKVGFLYQKQGNDSGINWKTIVSAMEWSTLIGRTGSYEAITDSIYKETIDDKGHTSVSMWVFIEQETSPEITIKTGKGYGSEEVEEPDRTYFYTWKSKILKESIEKHTGWVYPAKGRIGWERGSIKGTETHLLDYGNGANDSIARYDSALVNLPNQFIGMF
jgi:hypothetical protein